jgi:hypothetical protein
VEGNFVQVNKISFNNIQNIKNLNKNVKSPIQPTTAKTVIGLSAAVLTGNYIANRNKTQNKKNIVSLKKMGLGGNTIRTILGKESVSGRKVFGGKGIKILKEISELEDKTFYSNVMSNLNDIEQLNKVYNEKKQDSPIQYSILAVKPESTLTSQLIVEKDIIATSYTEDFGNYVVEKNRVYDRKKKIAMEDISKYQVLNNEKSIISKEYVVYDNQNNSIERTNIDLTKDDILDLPSSIKMVKFSDKGEMEGKYDISFDYSDVSDEELLNEDFKNYKIKTEDKNFKQNAFMQIDNITSEEYVDSFKRIVKNPLTGKVETQYLQKSIIPGVFNSTIVDEMGNKNVESFARKNPDGSIDVEKHFVSLDGTKTDYVYRAVPNQFSKHINQILDNNGEVVSENLSTLPSYNSKLTYKITSKDGEVLSTVDRTFTRISPTKTYSEVNGHGYGVERKGNKFIVTDTLTGEVTKIPLHKIVKGTSLIDLFRGTSSKKHSQVFNDMTGDMLLDMYKRGYKFKYEPDLQLCAMSEDKKIIQFKDDLFDFSHEQGHAKDFKTRKDLGLKEYFNIMMEDDIDIKTERKSRITSNPLVREIFEKERKMFMEAFPGIERKYVNYFIDQIDHYQGKLGGMSEVIGDANSLLSNYTGSASDDVMLTRGYYLQKYFPKTIAAVSKHIMPNSNIYVKND